MVIMSAFKSTLLVLLCVVHCSSQTANSSSSAPTTEPTMEPTVSPSFSPTHEPSALNTTTQSPIFTTNTAPPIHVLYELWINFTLNFTVPYESSVAGMDLDLKKAFSSVDIPSNYITNRPRIKNSGTVSNGDYFFFYYIFSRIEAANKSQAFQYESLVNAHSMFASNLKQILRATTFEASSLFMDIMEYNSTQSTNGGHSDNDTTQIIIWFGGVSAFCGIGALLLILCWKKFSAKEEDENDGAINLDFLLDSNANDPNLLTSPMHVGQGRNDDDEDEDDDDEDMLVGDVEPVKAKKAVKQAYFSRLGDDNTGDMTRAKNDDAQEVDAVQANIAEAEADEEDEIGAYQPPNFSRI